MLLMLLLLIDVTVVVDVIVVVIFLSLLKLFLPLFLMSVLFLFLLFLFWLLFLVWLLWLLCLWLVVGGCWQVVVGSGCCGGGGGGCVCGWFPQSTHTETLETSGAHAPARGFYPPRAIPQFSDRQVTSCSADPQLFFEVRDCAVFCQQPPPAIKSQIGNLEDGKRAVKL